MRCGELAGFFPRPTRSAPGGCSFFPSWREGLPRQSTAPSPPPTDTMKSTPTDGARVCEGDDPALLGQRRRGRAVCLRGVVHGVEIRTTEPGYRGIRAMQARSSPSRRGAGGEGVQDGLAVTVRRAHRGRTNPQHGNRRGAVVDLPLIGRVTYNGDATLRGDDVIGETPQKRGSCSQEGSCRVKLEC